MAAPNGAGPPASAGRIVVGVDGSPGSLAALCWALREASSRGLTVHAVAAWEFPMESTFSDMATVGDFHPVVAAEEILVSALADAGVAADDPTVTTAPVEGHPAEVLMRMASGARVAGGRIPGARTDLRGITRLGQPLRRRPRRLPGRRHQAHRGQVRPWIPFSTSMRRRSPMADRRRRDRDRHRRPELRPSSEKWEEQ